MDIGVNVSLAMEMDNPEGPPCVYIVAKNTKVTDKSRFGMSHCYPGDDAWKVCEEITSLKTPVDLETLKTRQEDVEYIKEVEKEHYPENKEGYYPGNLFSYTVKESTKGGARAGQKVVVYLADQDAEYIGKGTRGAQHKSIIAFGLSLW